MGGGIRDPELLRGKRPYHFERKKSLEELWER